MALGKVVLLMEIGGYKDDELTYVIIILYPLEFSNTISEFPH